MATQIACKTIGRNVLLLRSNGCLYFAKANFYGRGQIGTREVVGYGINGTYMYTDRPDYPYPAIRFREIKGDLIQLKEKEKGDWRNLSKEDVKNCKCQLTSNQLCLLL